MADCVIDARHADSLQAIRLTAANGVIEKIVPLDTTEPLPLIAPGLVDLQVNGYAGIDFNHYPFSPKAVAAVVEKLWQQGVTTFLPTVITASDRSIEQALSTLAAAREQPVVAAAVPGFHLEGPFLSPEDGPRGAHPLAHIGAPDDARFRRWQQAARGGIRLLTLSPEWANSTAFIQRCVGEGVMISIGHTSASAAQIADAVAAGASLSTHLGNGAHLHLPRHPNYIWQQLAQDELACAMIADGDHLPLAVLKVFMRAKGERAFLVSDVTCFAGMPPGEYQTPIGGRVTLSESGRLAVTETPALLAGSARGLLHGVNHLLQNDLASVGEALAMASLRPAKQLNLPQQQGLRAGAPADFLLLSPQAHGVSLRATYKAGRKVVG
ncbi:N-acetylglucosamine-6-phosphate deacetylase [Erwinia oleae]|uniref:N-acetylglucosamine-6-phosphate deacetylase n=1 Tax=Erwinia oleae TaxID=796334 RepID=UPI00055922AE|nr:amidohydrolase family protein [Erwinia oleae]